MEPINLSSKNWSWKYDGKHHEFSLGNTSTEGWFWHGKEDEILGFFIRLAKSKAANDFLNTVKKEEIDFEDPDIQRLLEKVARKKQGLYELSGDARLWHFGDTQDEEVNYLNEFLIKEDPDLDFSPEEEEEFKDYFWSHADTSGVTDFDRFAKKYGEDYYEDIEKCINSSSSFKEFFDNITGEFLVRSWMENYGGFVGEIMDEEYDKIKKEYLKEKGTKTEGATMKRLQVAKKLLEKGFEKEAQAVLADVSVETTAAPTPTLSIPVNLQKKLGDKAVLFDRYTKGVVNELVNKTKTLIVDTIKDRKERIIENLRKEYGKVGVDESKDLINAWLKYIYRDVLDETGKQWKEILKDSL